MEKEVDNLEKTIRKQHVRRIKELKTRIEDLREKKIKLEKQSQTYSVRVVKNEAAEKFLGDELHKRTIQDHLQQLRMIKYLRSEMQRKSKSLEKGKETVKVLEETIDSLKGEKVEMNLKRIGSKNDDMDLDSDEESDEELKEMMAELQKEKAALEFSVSESMVNIDSQIKEVEEKKEGIVNLERENQKMEQDLKEREEKWDSLSHLYPEEMRKAEMEYLGMEDRIGEVKNDLLEAKEDYEKLMAENEEEEEEGEGGENDGEDSGKKYETETRLQEILELDGHLKEMMQELNEFESYLIAMERNASKIRNQTGKQKKLEDEIQKLKLERETLKKFCKEGFTKEERERLIEIMNGITTMNEFCSKSKIGVQYSLRLKVKKSILFSVKEDLVGKKKTRIIELEELRERMKLSENKGAFKKKILSNLPKHIGNCSLKLETFLYSVTKQTFTLKIHDLRNKEIGILQVTFESLTKDHVGKKVLSEIVGKPLNIKLNITAAEITKFNLHDCFAEFQFFEYEKVTTKKCSGNRLHFNLEQTYKISKIDKKLYNYLLTDAINFKIFGDSYMKVDKKIKSPSRRKKKRRKSAKFEYKMVHVNCIEYAVSTKAKKVKAMKKVSVKFKFRGEEKKTKVLKKVDKSGQWMEVLEFVVASGNDEEVLSVELCQKNDVVASAGLTLRSCIKAGELATWFKIRSKKGEDQGRLKLSFNFV